MRLQQATWGLCALGPADCGQPFSQDTAPKDKHSGLAGKHWLLPASSDPGPRSQNGSADSWVGARAPGPPTAPASRGADGAQGPWSQSLSGTGLGARSILHGQVLGHARGSGAAAAHRLIPGPRPSCSWEKPGPASGQGQTGHGETTGRCRMCRGCSSACAATCDESGPHTSGPAPATWLHVPVASAGLPLARTRFPRAWGL